MQPTITNAIAVVGSLLVACFIAASVGGGWGAMAGLLVFIGLLTIYEGF